MSLPTRIGFVGAPPLKCQGIKTRLVEFIFRHIAWSPHDGGRWIEPFVGSGAVALNLAPRRAVLSDANPHLIAFYRAIQSGEMNADAAREFLDREGEKLSSLGAGYYYEVRRRFNDSGSPFDFLFLNRSCFNGVVRFNKRGEFNVPFGHRPERFSKAFNAKIADQIAWAAHQMARKDIEWRAADWTKVLSEANPDDFVYIDPPYIGRQTDYYNTWGEDAALSLASTTRELRCGFAVSMWLRSLHTTNLHVERCWAGMDLATFDHFYYVGSRRATRGEMVEALIIKPGFAVKDPAETPSKRGEAAQQSLFELTADGVRF